LTTINKLEKALASAKGLSADLKTFSQDTQDQQAKQMFSQLSTQMDNIYQTLQARVNYVKSEEPQYQQEAQGMTQRQNNKLQ
jgi:hypothetical protein